MTDTSGAALTDAQCDAIREALGSWARDIDFYAYGLPTHRNEESRAVIRAAALSTPPQAKQEASTEDARDAARYRWLRSVKSTGEWGRLGHYADSALDASIDLAMTKDRP